MHNGANHWLMSFSSNDLVQMCDSLYTNLTPVIKTVYKPATSLKLRKIGNYQLPWYQCRGKAMVTIADCLQLLRF